MKGSRTLAYLGAKSVASISLIPTLMATDWAALGISRGWIVLLVLFLTLADNGVQAYLRTITTTPVFEAE